MKKSSWAFTLVELVVVATILVILTSIGFYNYVGNLQDSRDSARQADLAKLWAALKLQHQKRGTYPNPGESFNITATWWTIAIQWKLNKDVWVSTLEQLSLDPKLNIPYTYSVTNNKQEYQLAATLENDDTPKALTVWNYSSVSINTLPTILVATTTDTNIVANNNSFIFDQWLENLPYSYKWDNGPVNGTSTLPELLSDPLINLYQNSDYRTCDEIKEAGKSIGDWEYQVRSSTGALTSTWCTSM